jgi:hypothetical protein
VRPRVAAVATLLVFGWGCGGSGFAHAPPTTASPFAWLKPRAAPANWRTTATAGGAVLSYPPGWHLISGDPGTASAALSSPGGLIVGYLNATPATPAEVPSWARFRVKHNVEEGERTVHLIAQARDLRFQTGTGACVIDSYQTSSSAYTEIACLVRGHRHPTVIIAAAASNAWAAQQAALHQAIDAFRTHSLTPRPAPVRE